MKQKTKNTPAEGGNLNPPKTAEYVRRRIDVDIGKVHVAPWNPRGKITPESVADLAASIRTLGMIQPVVCMMEPNGSLTLIAGHRRLVAAKLAGLKTIPCDALDGLDEATAKRMTFIENLQREDADPILEAELVYGLVKAGMTHAEIAAETGRGEKWVARRANLVNLSPSWRERARRGELITVDCLEHIAAHSLEIQERLKDASCNSYYGSSHPLSWNDISWEFKREIRDLREVLFDTEKCRSCPNNTGCCPDLFDYEVGKDATLGKCLDAKCYLKLTEQAIAAAVEAAEKRGRVVMKKAPYQCGVYGNTTKRPTKANTALYVFTDSMGNRTMEYAPPPKIKTDAEKAKDKEEKQAARECARRVKLLHIAKEEAAEKFEQWINDHEKDGIWPKWFIDCAIADLCEGIHEVGSDCENAVNEFAANTGFTASDAEADAVYKEFLAGKKAT